MIKFRYFFIAFLLSSIFWACKKSTSPEVDIPMPSKNIPDTSTYSLDQETYYDKVLGALVGSAIGDAMGASTEMWHRSAIQKEYGYINGLTTALREKSPEGTWQHNMVAGATTDDTRWKLLVGKYLSQHRGDYSDQHFATFITDHYQSLIKELADEEMLKSTDALDEHLEKVNWIKEWARVSLAYQKGGASYQQAQNRFYGGEMSCAGMLYTPMFGFLKKSPEAIYRTAYEHALFDIGYARDISSLVAAMTAAAFHTNSIDSILDTRLYVDPYAYQDSRLIGRLASAIAEESVAIIEQSQEISLKDSAKVIPPQGFNGSKAEWMQQDFIFSALEKKQKAISFHAGEIWQILFTSLEYGAGDFEKTMRFIVNYGRDNDTVAAVAGMILGAKDGYQKLPPSLRDEVLKVNLEVLGIDLEALAREIVEKIKD